MLMGTKIKTEATIVVTSVFILYPVFVFVFVFVFVSVSVFVFVFIFVSINSPSLWEGRGGVLHPFLYHGVGTARYILKTFWMFAYERFYVAYALALENLVNSYEDARFLYIAETVVDGCAEELHRRR